MANQDPHSVGDILDRLDELAQEHHRVLVGDMVDAFGSRSHGPFLLVPALLELSPVGGIPGVPTALAVLIALFAGQMLFGRKQLWVPQFIARRGFGAERLGKATKKLRPVARHLDRWFHGRLRQLTRGPFIQLAALACMGLAATVPFLEILPFASSAPMGAIALFGVALLVRDGALMLGATALAVAAVGLVFGVAG